MGMKSVLTGMFLVTTMYLMFLQQIQSTLAAPGNANNAELHRTHTRPFARLFPARNQYSRIKTDPLSDFIVDDDDLFELPKRQTSDDYGHLRFGKRAEDAFADDYGHMRFGRSDK